MQKSAITKLKKIGLSEESIDFLLQFYTGAVNAYGIISLEDLYGLYKDIKRQNHDYPEITFDQFLTFGEVTGSKLLEHYAIFSPEIINKYFNDSGIPLTSPLLVHESVAWKEDSIHEIWYLYMDLCEFSSKFYLTPDDLRDFAEHQETADDRAFQKILAELKAFGKPLDQVESQIYPNDTGINEITKLVTYAYQTSPGNLEAASEEFENLSLFYRLDYGKHTFQEICTLMKRALYDLPCWGLGGYTYGKMMGIPKEDITENDFFDDSFYKDDNDLFDLDEDDVLTDHLQQLGQALLDLASDTHPHAAMRKKASYPKRLLDKTMKKRYADAGFDTDKLDFLHKFFQAAVNLYGVIELVDLAQIYEDIKDKNHYPDISDDEFIDFAELVRREKVPYYVFEQHELFKNVIDLEFERILVDADLLGPDGLKSLEGVYNVYFSEYANVYWEPEDMLAYTGHQQEKEELDMLAYFTQLGSRDA
ncbi:hypothetical protein ME784_03560 [Lactobacillus delbrueckii]|nr:hypothetical protein [Lactobacillus delbrueckii]GHN19841.1 hypothetical protein ME784_03560 [Lactobacillus delbrueckii]